MPLFDPPLAFAASAVEFEMPSGMFQTWDGVVYLLTTGNGFLAYDLTKGSLLWKVPLINGPARLGNTGR